MSGVYDLARKLLFKMDAEQAHNLTLKMLKTGLVPKADAIDDPALKVSLWNRKFPNPVGLAAGFDKNAEVIAPMFRLGFGFVEVGTVTPKPQHGNPKPRVFRAPEQEAVINRMGFPNAGLNKFKSNLQQFLEGKERPAGLVGINIGMNKSQTDAAADYCLLIRQLFSFADYMTINISSPNTPGLRDLQERDNFLKLASSMMAEREKSCGIDPPPLLVKFAPDLTEEQQEGLAKAVIEAGLDGVILTNTTLDRPESLPESFRSQKGGLSGKPVRDKSTAVIRNFYTHTKGKIPIIGLGGIDDASSAYEKIRAGATLVQLYTGLVFKGPDVVRDINMGLLDKLKQDGFAHISEAVGADVNNNNEKQTRTTA